jgi:hypothetical protein
MRVVKRRLQNGLEECGYESKSERFLYATVKEQVFIIPSVAFLIGSYPYKYRVGFAFGIWLFSVGFARRGRKRLFQRLKGR